jgi:three-Cys-motif partner protein
MSKASNRKVYRLPQHSLAKISVYKRYLSIYLNVLGNTQFHTIYLIDLFAGEGRDVDGKACSSIAAIEALDQHIKTSNNVCKKVVVFFNDIGKSVIEKDTKKIDRVKRLVDAFKLPSQYQVKYEAKDFNEIALKVIQRLNKLGPSEKALCFIDPWGYKYSKPALIKEFLANGRTELLLFVPICFMHRFAAKALKDEDFLAGQHIEQFISELYENEIPDIKSQVTFIKGILRQFKTFLGVKYVDVLYIEKEKNQYFALFFFSNSKRGFQKMLEAKWSIDESEGRAFSVNRSAINPILFESIDHENYTFLLFQELRRRGIMTNQEIFDFGLENNHLPKHSKKVLDELKKDSRVVISSENGITPLGYYLEDGHPNRVFFTPVK